MKKTTWRFKKWFQRIIEGIVATNLLLVMAVADVGSMKCFIILGILLLNAAIGVHLLNKYGRY